MMENGQHTALIEYGWLLVNGVSGNQYAMALIGFFQGFAVQTLAFLGSFSLAWCR